MKRLGMACICGCLAFLAGAARVEAQGQCGDNFSLFSAVGEWSRRDRGDPGAPCLRPPIVINPGCPSPGMPYPVGPGGTPGVTPPGVNPNPNPNQPDMTQPGATPSDAFARAPEAGTQPAASVDPGFFGDLIGITGNRVTVVGVVPRGVTAPALPGTRILRGNIIAVVAPQPLHASYKVSEGESPRPQNRVYFAYNFYNNVDRLFEGTGIGQSDLHREMIGWEQTLLQGDASFGLRLPFLQLTGNDDVRDNQVGDLTMIFKYALINDRETRNLLSTGMLVTLPTGQGLQIEGESELHSTVFQPFLGWIYNIDDFYFEGFSSVAVPTDFRDVTLMFNSFSVGYWMYRDNARDAFMSSIAPTLELHVNTPLSHRGLESTPVNFSDSVNLTAGVHVIFQRAVFGVAAGTPLTGPRPYDFEVASSLAFHY